jgi:hypothetical protein
VPVTLVHQDGIGTASSKRRGRFDGGIWSRVSEPGDCFKKRCLVERDVYGDRQRGNYKPLLRV